MRIHEKSVKSIDFIDFIDFSRGAQDSSRGGQGFSEDFGSKTMNSRPARARPELWPAGQSSAGALAGAELGQDSPRPQLPPPPALLSSADGIVHIVGYLSNDPSIGHRSPFSCVL